MIQVVYQLFNSFRFKKEFAPLFTKKESELAEEQTDKIQKPLWFEINRSEFKELTRDIYNNQNNNNLKIILKLP